MSETIHLWDSRTGLFIFRTKCGIQATTSGKINALWSSTATKLKLPPDAVCKTCYRLGPPWLVLVK